MADNAGLRDVSYGWFGGAEPTEELSDSDIEEVDESDEDVAMRFFYACYAASGGKTPRNYQTHVAMPVPEMRDCRYACGQEADFLFLKILDEITAEANVMDVYHECYKLADQITSENKEDLRLPINVDDGAEDLCSLLTEFREYSMLEQIKGELWQEFDNTTFDSQKEYFAQIFVDDSHENILELVHELTSEYVPKMPLRKPVLPTFGACRSHNGKSYIITIQ